MSVTPPDDGLEGARALQAVTVNQVWVDEPAFRTGSMGEEAALQEGGLGRLVERAEVLANLRVQGWMAPLTVEDFLDLDLERRVYAAASARKAQELRGRGIIEATIRISIDNGAIMYDRRCTVAKSLKQGTLHGGMKRDAAGAPVAKFTREQTMGLSDDLVDRLYRIFVAKLSTEASPFFDQTAEGASPRPSLPS